MSVLEGPDALKAKVRGTTFYFCSGACRLEYVMPTGDDDSTAKAVAKKVGVTSYRAVLLPADKEKEEQEL